jgi:hypothetical protein
MNDNYLRRIRQTWYVQVRVPRPLVPILGKQHLLKSTKTRDIVEARRRRHAIVAEFHGLIDAARQLQVTHEGGIVGDLLNEAALMRRQMKTGQLTHEEVLGVAEYDPDTGERHETFGLWELLLDKLDRLPPSALSDVQSKAIRDAGDALRTPRVHLSDCITAFLADNPRLRPSTLHKREVRLNEFMRWAGDIAVDTLTRQHSGRYVAEVLQRRKRPLSTNTIRQTISDMSTWFRWCRARGMVTVENPFEGIASTVRGSARGTADKTHTRRRAWNSGELESLVKNATGDILVLSMMALFTGCRINELCEAQLEDVHDTHLHI